MRPSEQPSSWPPHSPPTQRRDHVIGQTQLLARRASLDGVREIRPHSLRVAFITGTREAGVPLEDVQDAAGHADPRTTRRYDRGRIPSTDTPPMPSPPG